MSGNVKVHFAGSDNKASRIVALKAAGVRYRLFTAYPFIESKPSGSRMTVEPLYETNGGGFAHTIVDSGLFTLMFGAKKGVAQTEDTIREWMHRIVSFHRDNDIPNASFVECDCQKIVGVDAAWRLRREMRELMPDAEIINVFHLPDGEDGFRRLVDFSSYIAISVPELRMSQPKGYKRNVHALAMLARRIKPSVKIHLLGCTEVEMLKKNTFCTSADSSSWLSPSRYGFIDGHHVKTMKADAIQDATGRVRETAKRLSIRLTEKATTDAARRCIEARWFRARYQMAAGNQD